MILFAIQISPSILSHLQHASPLEGIALSKLTLSCMEDTLQQGWEDSTRDKYQYSIKWYTRCCRHENIPVERHFPAHKVLLCAVAASAAGSCSGSSAHNYMATL